MSVGILATTIESFCLSKKCYWPLPSGPFPPGKVIRNKPFKTKATFATKQNSREKNLLTFLNNFYCSLMNIEFIFLFIYLIYFKDLIYFQREGKGGRKRGRETSVRGRNISWLPLALPQPGTWPRNPGMYPDRVLNQRPFSSEAGAQSTELHQPGHKCRI